MEGDEEAQAPGDGSDGHQDVTERARGAAHSDRCVRCGLEVLQRLGGQFPGRVAPRQMMAQLSIEEGRPELALSIVQQLKAQFPPTDSIEASALAKEGRRQEALRLLLPFEDKYPRTGIPMQWLERSADRHESQALNLAVHPACAHLRNSPEFVALEKRIGLEGVSPLRGDRP